MYSTIIVTLLELSINLITLCLKFHLNHIPGFISKYLSGYFTLLNKIIVLQNVCLNLE